MKRFLIILALMFLVTPVFADVGSAVLIPSCTPVAGGINFCPLVPVVNDLITGIAGMAALATPVLVGLLAKWLYNHGINMSQQTQKVVSDRLTTTFQNGLKYATSGLDVGIQKITIPVSNDAVRTAANYAIAQSPALLKKAGIDVTTDEGQQSLIRRITAEAQPTPAAMSPGLNVTDTTIVQPPAVT